VCCGAQVDEQAWRAVVKDMKKMNLISYRKITNTGIWFAVCVAVLMKFEVTIFNQVGPIPLSNTTSQYHSILIEDLGEIPV
jgi:hypothetical protein